MLGEELKRRREDMGLSLAQISETTRIGTRFLRAIESDDFKILPEGIYTRSFIRAFAKQVNMDEDEALRLYQEQTGHQNVAVVAEMPEPVEDEEPFVYKEPSTGFWPAAAVAAALALVLCTGAWALFHYIQRSGSESEVASTPTTPPEPTPQVPASTQQSVADDGSLKVTLEASDRCWIRYTADDGKPTQMMLESGAVEQIHANESIDLSIGNTKVIPMQINGRDAHFPADTGVVLRKLTITPETAQTLVN